jgi:hypothetical protein
MSDRLDPASVPDTHESFLPPANRTKWSPSPPPLSPFSFRHIFLFSIPVIPASLSEINVIVSVEYRYPREKVGGIVARLGRNIFLIFYHEVKDRIAGNRTNNICFVYILE